VILHDATEHWRLEEAAPGKMVEPGLVMFFFGTDLFYANAGFFSEQVRKLVHESPSLVRWLVIDAGAITGIDLTAGKAVRELHQDLAKDGVVLAFARVQLRPRGDFERMGLLELIGANRMFESRHACIQAYKAECLSGNTLAEHATAQA
jgi:MFS superfamily sulfate permease-like transporter